MKLADVRKVLHRLAETAHKEEQTAAYVIERLQKSGIGNIRKGIGGHGILATVDSGREGPSILFRAELDALPIDESIDVPHASRTKGVSHKCGHDGHMTILLGLAAELRENPPTKGRIYLLFQPAEETGEGAERMLNDSRLQDLAPDHVFALHNLPGFPLQTVILRDGIFAAGSWGLIVRLKGITAHAAHPEEAKTPASATANLIHEWQNLPRTVIPFDHAGLVTVIHARMGEQAFGTTPGYAEVMATLRAHDSGDLEKLGERAVELARMEAQKWDLEMEYEWTERFQPTINNSGAVKLVEKVAQELKEKSGGETVPEVIRRPQPFSWSEDFGRFTERFSGALFGLGSGTDQPHMHNPSFDFPDEILRTGVLLFSGIIDAAGLRDR